MSARSPARGRRNKSVAADATSSPEQLASVFRPRLELPILAACVLAVLAALWPLLSAGFTTWDDQELVAKNPALRAPIGDALLQFWDFSSIDRISLAGREHLYVPVTYDLWELAASVGGQDPLTGQFDAHVFHLANVMLHLSATALVYLILRRFASPAAAAAGALLFGLHPLQVEPVGWVCGTKDVLYGMLCLAALWVDPLAGIGELNRTIGPGVGNDHSGADGPKQRPALQGRNAVTPRSRGRGAATTRIAGGRGIIRYALATVLFALAVLSKPTAMVLPVIVLAFSWTRGGVTRKVILRLVPWVAISIACAFWTSLLQGNPASVQSALWLRPLVALHALGFYIVKLLAPLRLGIDYGCSPTWLRQHPAAWALGLIPLVLAALLVGYRRRARLLTAAAAVFLVALLPVLGLVAFDFQLFSTVADRYLYLSMFGAAMAVAFVLSWATARLKPRAATVFQGVVFLALGVLGVRSWFQARYWHDSRTLFDHALTVNPDSLAALNGEVRLANDEHRPEAAENFARRSLAVRPDYADAIVGLGYAYAAEGRSEEALGEFQRAAQVDPTSADALLNIGVAMVKRGRLDEAETDFEQVVRMYPNNPKAHLDLGNVLLQKHNPRESLVEMESAVHLDPSDPEAHANLGWLYVGFGRRNDARAEFGAALAINPVSPLALKGLQRLDSGK